MAFIGEIVYLKEWGIYNKYWWLWINIGNHWIAIGVEYIPKEIKKLTGNKNTKTKIYRIQVNDSIIYGYFCFGLTNFMLKGKILLDHANLFSSNEYEKNEKITLKHFQ